MVGANRSKQPLVCTVHLGLVEPCLTQCLLSSPFLFILPSTNIFVGYYNEARILDPATFDTLTVLPNMPGNVNNDAAGRTYPMEGSSVMLPQHARELSIYYPLSVYR